MLHRSNWKRWRAHQEPVTLVDSSGSFVSNGYWDPSRSYAMKQGSSLRSRTIERSAEYSTNILVDLQTNYKATKVVWPEPYDSSCNPPSISENTEVVNTLKNRKASEEDGIPIEVFETCLFALIDRSHGLFRFIREVIPSDWGTSIPKNGNQTVCEDYRSINFINGTTKICVLLFNRFADAHYRRSWPN